MMPPAQGEKCPTLAGREMCRAGSGRALEHGDSRELLGELYIAKPDPYARLHFFARFGGIFS